jgi:hypothetical protein
LESATSNWIYLWSKGFGAILLIAMAIVAVGNAQQFSAGKKGKVKGQAGYPGRTLIFRQAVGSLQPHKGGPLLGGKAGR